jgi:hypothetical protein
VATNKTFDGETISAAEFTARVPNPVLLHFQPEQFTLVEGPDELRKWEELLVQRVGVNATVGRAIIDAMRTNGGTCCESGDTNDCDVD